MTPGFSERFCDAAANASPGCSNQSHLPFQRHITFLIAFLSKGASTSPASASGHCHPN